MNRKGPLGLWDFPLLNGILGFNTQIQRSKSTGSRYIVAASEDKTTISPVFARAPYFLIIENGNIIQEISNPYISTGGGAGPKAAEFVSRYGPTYVVAGSFGAYAESELRKKGIIPLKETGAIRQLLGC